MTRKSTDRGRVVWLVTWEGTGSPKRQEEKIAAILSARCSPKHVAEIVELIYANNSYSISEKLGIAARTAKNQYPVVWDTVHGILWRGRMTCGHNPYLFARIVDNFRVLLDDDGDETATWTKRSRPIPSIR
jgi:hypothetical protein